MVVADDAPVLDRHLGRPQVRYRLEVGDAALGGVLNRVWVGDITYVRTWRGWLYLGIVIDAHSRRVIGWAIAEHMRTGLVEQTLRMAITLHGELPAGVVFHADRGTQNASAQIAAFATDNGITRSMGRTKVCWDNAIAE